MIETIERKRAEQATFCREHGLEATQVSVLGLSLHVVRRFEPERPCVIFLHGVPDTWWVWRHQLAFFAGLYSLVAVDLPGFGESSIVPKSQMAIQRVLVPALCDVLDMRPGPVHVVGHDVGALVAWYLALALGCRPRVADATHARLSSLTVFGIGHPSSVLHELRRPINLWRSRHWAAFSLPKPIGEQVVGGCDFRYLRRLTRTPTAEGEWRTELSRPGRLSAMLDVFRANTLPTWRILGSPDLHADVLALCTREDVALTNAEQLAGSRRYVRGQFQLERLDAGGHWCMRENPTVVNRHLQNHFGTCGEGQS